MILDFSLMRILQSKNGAKIYQKGVMVASADLGLRRSLLVPAGGDAQQPASREAQGWRGALCGAVITTQWVFVLLLLLMWLPPTSMGFREGGH